MAMETLQNELRDALMFKMAEGKDDKDEKFDEMGCVKEMKKLTQAVVLKKICPKVHKSPVVPKGDFENYSGTLRLTNPISPWVPFD